jgi:type IV secretory pathway VirB6-like protein
MHNAIFKAVALVLFVLLFGAAYKLWEVLGYDPQTFKDFGTLTAILLAIASILLARAILSPMGLYQKSEDGPGKLMIVTFAAAVLLAGALSFYHYSESQDARRSAQNMAAEREQRGSLERSANVQAGIDALQSARARRATTTTATTQPK